MASWFTGVWACTTQGMSTRTARAASPMSSSGSGARRREVVMTYPRLAEAKNRGGGGRLCWSAVHGGLPSATGSVTPSAVSSEWTDRSSPI